MREWWYPFRLDLPLDITVSRIRRALPRLRRHNVPQPWAWERLATPEEQALLLAKTDVRKAA